MKRICTMLLATIPLAAAADTSVSVMINNVSSTQGQLVLTAYDSKKTWLKKPVAQEVRPAKNELVINLELPKGTYAFQVFHDLDDNGKMKTNFIGIPKEPTGVSNNAKGRFGPPKFRDAAVEIGDDLVMVRLTLVEID